MSRISTEALLGMQRPDIMKMIWPITKNLEKICKVASAMQGKTYEGDPYPELGSIANDVAPVTADQFFIELDAFRNFWDDHSVEEIDKAWEVIQLIALSVGLQSDEEKEKVQMRYQAVADEWMMRRYILEHGTLSFERRFFPAVDDSKTED